MLRFLGGKPYPNLTKEVTSSTRHRPEGWRVKHTMGRNFIKVYDKANVLRVETTINDPSELRVLRLLADKVRRFGEDTEIAEALSEAKADLLSQPTLPDGHGPVSLGRLRAEVAGMASSGGLDAIAAQGYGNERLDQLVNELVEGVC